MRRRSGFTLIELLVVIAIIAILAGMLFPVFARARESARKIQCLANVKNIATAVQMYLVDYDKFWPSGHSDANAVQLVMDQCGCVRDCRVTTWHPYLRVPVILDEYIRNRDVWACPSAHKELGAGHGFPVNPCIPNWYTAATRDGCRALGCEVFPPGWGGSVTDSMLQGACSGDGGGAGAFRMSISNPCILRNLKTASLRDPSRMVVAGDAGVSIDQAMYTHQYAYPDYKLPQGMLQENCGGHFARGHCDDASCGDYGTASSCTWLSPCFGGDTRIITDVSYRKTHARHLGGANLGFADGHAAWMDSEVILRGGADHSRWGIHPQVFYGMCVCINLDENPRSTRPVVDDPTWGHY